MAKTKAEKLADVFSKLPPETVKKMLEAISDEIDVDVEDEFEEVDIENNLPIYICDNCAAEFESDKLIKKCKACGKHKLRVVEETPIVELPKTKVRRTDEFNVEDFIMNKDKKANRVPVKFQKNTFKDDKS